MKARLTLKPGQRGTKSLAEKYGDALYRVRYRYDERSRKRYKTVELIVEEKEWQPPPPSFPAHALVSVRIAYEESDLQLRAKEAGGRWDRAEKVWLVRYGKIAGTVLEKRIVLKADEGATKASKP